MFESRYDSERVRAVLETRPAQCGLALHWAKPRMVEFRRPAVCRKKPPHSVQAVCGHGGSRIEWPGAGWARKKTQL